MYISPLKALGVDVERNLRAPLVGITQTARIHGREPREISVGVRSGDTPGKERRRLVTDPPDILITTPESLYLMLTSKARASLTDVHTVIIDEVHAVAGTKRGAHLAVSLERLDQILQRPAQRIGLSATVEPVETVARFLGGTAPVSIVRPPLEKRWDLRVSVPVPDMSNLTTPVPRSELPKVRTGLDAGSAASGNATLEDALGLDLESPLAVAEAERGGSAKLPPDTPHEVVASIWPHVEERIVDLVEANRSTIVFANSRGLAERLTSRLNEVHAFREEQRGNVAPSSGPSTRSAGSGMRVEAPRRGPAAAPAGPGAATATLDDAREDARTGSREDARPGSSEAARPDVNDAAHDAGAPEIPYAPPAVNHLTSGTAPAELARAHHGSVSKDQRALIEDALKSGRLRCVVATSSLELGIDMGAVDLVIQVESPPSVASGLQRVGRAGHQVGEVSRAVMYPKHRGDLLSAAVTVDRMRAGRIEPLSIPANPLDVLAQQTVAACALGPIDVEAWFEALRHTAPFAAMPRSAYDAVLDLLSGKYPSDEFAELRPRLVWDRDAGVLEPRPGSQRVAVTSGGTIPDRGLYPVYIVGSDETDRGPKRVGELDEEMVYESRAGDVIALGATSWRIEEITHDRVSVTPAPGQVGKLPFWHGDGPGRPVDLGEATGRFTRELASAFEDGEDDARAAERRLAESGLDQWAVDNLRTYVTEQTAATAQVPSEKTMIVERFRDELGDWRVVLHSPYGMPVHAPWALAVGARIDEKYGLDGSAMAADDGIVLRVPAMEEEPPGADLFMFDPEDLDAIVTEQVGSSALFASRFRECAARALLLPRRDPGKRTPLWQQRQRSAQLLDVARKYPSFPIILETVRECLQDVYDLPALRGIHERIAGRQIAVREVETSEPSPFAKTLLFGYVGQFLYNTDAPLAERKAAALSLDPSLLAELLGRDELRELLDPDVVEETEAQLQRLAEDRRMRGAEGLADLLRLLGPLSVEEAARRLTEPDAAGAAAEELVAAHRAIRVRVGGEERIAAVEDAARLRDGLGLPLPMGVPAAFIEPVPDPLGDLVSRYARTHGPFTTAEAAAALGLGRAVVETVLERFAADRRVVSGRFVPAELLARRRGDAPGEEAEEWCEAGVLRTIRRRSLAKLRSQIEPVDVATYARFLPAWQRVRADGSAEDPRVGDADGLLTVIDQLAGVPVPASALETLVLPSRVKRYSPAMLDEAMSGGEVLWTGVGTIPGQDGWVALHLAESADLTVRPEPAIPLDDLSADARAVYAAIGDGADFVPRIAARAGFSLAKTGDALWELVWAGLATNDTAAPLRAFLDGGRGAHSRPKAPARARSAGRRGAGRIATARRGRAPGLGGAAGGLSATGPTGSITPGMSGLTPQRERELSGRWSRVSAFLDEEPLEETVRAVALAQLMLDRYGVLTRGAVAQEETPGGFAAVYQILAAQEDQGDARRGYFVDGLGGAQFAAPSTVDLLRSSMIDEQLEGSASTPRTPQVLVLAATDPANAYGATLSWPDPVPAAELLGGADDDGRLARPGRKAGALVVLVDGRPVLYVERGGKTMLAFSADARDLELAAPAVARAVRLGAVDKLVVEKVNGLGILERVSGSHEGPDALGSLRQALVDAGFYTTPRGIRMRREAGTR
ncbi:DEAD/DEAH box helicase [Rothia sp. AR01]|uniref:DEAD/DEAH box helicase n=1 Tax=Rothia santali TaxID=2949643 RepID=A0A9X2HAL0_9MICC|nr:DEAD/DEAH box helicase [Rothia santali]